MIIIINYNLKNRKKETLVNGDIKEIIQQLTKREEAKINMFLSNDNTIKLYRYTVLLNKRKSKTIDFSKIIQNSQFIQVIGNKQECNVYVTSISILSKNEVVVAVTTNKIVNFYFHRKGGKWELYKIITKIIMESPIIKVKEKNKWRILTPEEIKKLFSPEAS